MAASKSLVDQPVFVPALAVFEEPQVPAGVVPAVADRAAQEIGQPVDKKPVLADLLRRS